VGTVKTAQTDRSCLYMHVAVTRVLVISVIQVFSETPYDGFGLAGQHGGRGETRVDRDLHSSVILEYGRKLTCF